MSFARTLVIETSPDRVFSILADLEQSRQWMPAILKIEVAGSGPVHLGTVWTETRKAGKREMTSKIQVVAFDPPRRLGLEVDSKMMKGQMVFTLSPEQNGTKVHYEAQMQGKGFFRLMSGKMNKMMAAEDNDLLERLRKQARAGSS